MEKYFKQISTWGRLIGILMMVYAGLGLLAGLFFSVVLGAQGGLLFAILALLIFVLSSLATGWVGKILYDSGSIAKQWLVNPSEELQDQLIAKYGDYSYANVMIMIASVVLMTPMVIVFIILAMGMSGI